MKRGQTCRIRNRLWSRSMPHPFNLHVVVLTAGVSFHPLFSCHLGGGGGIIVPPGVEVEPRGGGGAVIGRGGWDLRCGGCIRDTVGL
jgi:hypothetical protein